VSLDLETGNLVGEIYASVRIVRSCGDCGNAMKEAMLEMSDEGNDGVLLSGELLIAEGSLDEGGHIRLNEETKKYEWLDGHGAEGADHYDPEPLQEIGGRYAKSYFGATIVWYVNCACREVLVDGTLEDKVAASEMDEL